MAVFASVVEASSFTAAARRLGVPKVAVSRAIASLERRLGVSLLTRTTRRMELTAAGQALLPYCERVLAQVTLANRQAAPAAPLTSLRVAADAAYGRLLLAPLIPRFLESFPDIPLQVELLGPPSGWDVLVCNGTPPVELPASQEGAAATPLTATALGRPLVILCASAAYARSKPLPASPAELGPHPLLLAVAEEHPTLRFMHGTQETALHCEPRLAVSDPAVVHSATVAGLGVGVLPEFLCRQGLATGKLVRVLPQWNVAGLLDLHAVCELRNLQDPAVSAFIRFLSANMVPALAH